MERTRSEYRLAPLTVDPPTAVMPWRQLQPSDRDAVASLLLDAYRGTIDDEGETIDEALAAADDYLGEVVGNHSVLVTDGDRIVAMALAVMVDGLHYVDPVIVAADRKQAGLGRDAVRLLLASLRDAGVVEVRATITDGNTASERLFTGLGFVRHAAWG